MISTQQKPQEFHLSLHPMDSVMFLLLIIPSIAREIFLIFFKFSKNFFLNSRLSADLCRQPSYYFIHSPAGSFLSMQFIPIIVHTHDRCFLIDHLIDLRRLFPRQVSTAMRSAVNIDFFRRSISREASCSPIPPLNGIQ